MIGTVEIAIKDTSLHKKTSSVVQFHFNMFSKRISVLAILAIVSFVTVNGNGWEDYTRDQLVGQGLANAAICGFDGSIWGKSSGFRATKNEILNIYRAFSNPSQLRSNGLFLNSQKYMVIKADDSSIYAKKGTGGVVCVKTGQTITIGIYDDKLQPGKATSIVEIFGDYLRDSGY